MRNGATVLRPMRGRVLVALLPPARLSFSDRPTAGTVVAAGPGVDRVGPGDTVVLPPEGPVEILEYTDGRKAWLVEARLITAILE